VQHGGPSDNSGGGYAQGNSIAYDPTGNIIACGIFDTQSAVFGADQFTTGGFADIFVLKLSAGTGAYVWTKQAGSGNADVAASVCTDNTGKVFLTGAYGNAGTLGTFPISAASGFVTQLNSAGIAQWAHEVHNGSVPINGGSGLATDAAGTLYMAGGYAGTAHFGADSLVSPVASSPAVFVVAYSNAGGYQWGLTDAGLFSNCAGTCVSVSPTGFVNVGGLCSPNSTFGTTSFSGYGSLIAQINSGVSGIEGIAIDRSLIVYPNPATDILWMMSDKPLRNVMIIDARGQGTAVRMNDDHALDIRSLAAGVYCLRATVDEKMIFARFAKQ